MNLIQRIRMDDGTIRQIENGDAHLDGPQSAVQWAAEKLNCDPAFRHVHS
jgi:hypothetical protein